MTTIDEFKEKIHNRYKPEEGKLYVTFTRHTDKIKAILQEELNSFSYPKCESILPIDFSISKKDWKFLGMLFNSIEIVSNGRRQKLHEEYLSILKESITIEQSIDSFFNTIGFNTSESGILSQFKNKVDKRRFIQSVIEYWPERKNSASIEDIFFPLRYREKKNLLEKIAFSIILPITLEKRKIRPEFVLEMISDFQNLLIKNVSIFILIPDVSNEVQTQFKQLFWPIPIVSKETDEITEEEINISQGVIDWVNMNYEMLNYNTQSPSNIDIFKIFGLLNNSVSRDIAGLRYLLESCLLGQFQRSKFDKLDKKIQKNWDETVKKHKNLYPQASRKRAPDIVIARKLGGTGKFIKKEFKIGIKEPFNIFTINNVILEKPEVTIRKLFTSYLDGETINESNVDPKLRSLIDDIFDLLSNTSTSINKNEILEAVLLQGKKIIAKEFKREKRLKKSKIERWLDSNWKTILSVPNVSTIKECSLANKKKLLLDDPLLREDQYHWIYCKLKKDMLELRSKYIDELKRSIQFLGAEDLEVSFDDSEIESHDTIKIYFRTRNKPPLSLILTIETPYYNVKLNGESISTPLPQVVFEKILTKLRDYLFTGADISQPDREKIFLKCIKMYSIIHSKKPEEMIFVEDLIEFIQNLPNISDAFRYTEPPSVQDGLKKILSDRNFLTALTEKGLNPQMKGSDSYDSFTSDGKSYVGFVLTKKFLENGE